MKQDLVESTKDLSRFYWLVDVTLWKVKRINYCMSKRWTTKIVKGSLQRDENEGRFKKK